MIKTETLDLVVDLWRRRVEWLWSMCEQTAGRPLDIDWLDEQIIEDEARNARDQTPKG